MVASGLMRGTALLKGEGIDYLHIYIYIYISAFGIKTKTFP